MNSETTRDDIIPAKGHASLELLRGQTLRIIDVEGKQVVDLVAVSARDKGEKLSCVYSNVLNGTWKIRKGHTLYTDRANPILFLEEDTVGLHYTGGGFCTEELNFLRFGVRNTENCGDNLRRAFEPFGIDRGGFNFDSCFNVFMNFTFEPDGSMKLDEPLSRAGDFVDLKAEMDTIVALSNCPQDRNSCNGFKPTPVRIQVYGK